MVSANAKTNHPKVGENTLVFIAPLKSRKRAKIRNMGVSKTVTPASSKALNLDFKDNHVLFTFKIKREIPNSIYGCIKDQ